MSKLKFSKSKLSKFISSKGFYVAIAICLVGAGTATWLAVDRTLSGIEDANNRLISDEAKFDPFPQVEEAETKQPDVPRPTAPSTSSASSSSSSTAESSSEPSSQPAAASEPSETSTESPASPSLVYALPVRGNIINPFSGGELVKNVTLNDWRTHDGIDIAADKGTDIYAAADGVVSEIRQDSLWGTILTITHADATQTLYYGLEASLPVAEGDSVIIKQVIGRLDSIPCEVEEDSHLHFAMKRDGAWIDPLNVIANLD